MQIKLKVDYNETYRKGSSCEGMADNLKARLVKVGLASEVKPVEATPKPKAAKVKKGVPDL